MELFYLISIILLSRLIYLFNHGSLKPKQLVMKLSLLSLPLFIFEVNIALLGLLLLLVVVGIGFHLYEITGLKSKALDIYRFAELLVFFVIINIFNSKAIGLEFDDSSIVAITNVSSFISIFDFISVANFAKFWIIIAGLLFVMNEPNFMIRIIFEKFKLKPEGKEKNISEDQAGRIIGILERIIIYALILIGQFEAIGVIIAVKALARFKAMDEKPFAEYVLIGTLLSLLITFGTAGFISRIIS